MVSCVACGCSAINKTKKEGTTFHRFPKNPKQKKLWIEFLNKPNFDPLANHFLCSKHFKDDCFDRTSLLKVRLKPDAVPTIRVSRLKYCRNYNPTILEHTDVPEIKSEIEETDDMEILTIIGHSASTTNRNSPVPVVSSTIGNSSDRDTPQKHILKLQISDLQATNMLKSIKLRELQKVTWRQNKKIASLKCEVEELKQKNTLLEQENVMLEHYNQNNDVEMPKNKDNVETLTIEIVEEELEL